MPKTPLSILASLLLASCGGGPEPAPAAGPDDHAEHHGGEAAPHAEHGDADEQGEAAQDDHGTLPAGLQAFHDAFSPIWHADAGPERAAEACDAAPQLVELAGPAESDVPDTDAGLPAAVDGLVSACDDGDAVDAALVPVHDAFHVLVEASAAP